MSYGFCFELTMPGGFLNIPASRLLLCARDDEHQAATDKSRLLETVRKAQRGDRDGFEWLIQTHLAFISREISKLVPAAALEDVAQEVCMRVFRALPRYSEQGAFCGWLRKIIGRACIDYWRSERRQERSGKACVEQTDPGAVRAQNPSQLALADLEKFLNTLSAVDRLVFTLVFLDDRPHREAAQQLGVSLAAIKVRSFRLKRKAREWFDYE